MEQKFIKPPVEVRYKEELDALAANDTSRKPENWVLSPKAVRTFILGSSKPITASDGRKIEIRKKFFTFFIVFGNFLISQILNSIEEV